MPVDNLLFLIVMGLDFKHHRSFEMRPQLTNNAVRLIEVYVEGTVITHVPAVLPDAGDTGRRNKDILRVQPHQNIHVNTRMIIESRFVCTGQSLIQITDTLCGLGGQNNMRVCAVFLKPVLDEVSLSDVTPLEAILLGKVLALPDVSFGSVFAA